MFFDENAQIHIPGVFGSQNRPTQQKKKHIYLKLEKEDLKIADTRGAI